MRIVCVVVDLIARKLTFGSQSQPSNILFALRALHAALAPLIGAELALGHAVPAGWADEASKEKIAAWRTRGMDDLKDELERVAQSETAAAYAELMRNVFFGHLFLGAS